MESYNRRAEKALERWKLKVAKDPSFIDKATKGIQVRLNEVLPEKYHEIMTAAIKSMTKVVILGSKYTAIRPYIDLLLVERDDFLMVKAKTYSRIAMLEGAGTGAGGLMLGLADFPLLLSIKMKFLYDAAAIYGFDTKDYRERLYILYIFQLAFSSQEKSQEIFYQMEDWDNYVKVLPRDIDAFDWASFQQEYRDYIDLAKLLQLMPGIGFVVGAYVNKKLLDKLSETAKYAYHTRLLKNHTT